MFKILFTFFPNILVYALSSSLGNYVLAYTYSQSYFQENTIEKTYEKLI